MSNAQCSIVIVGGGHGQRAGLAVPKQYADLEGKPVWAWSVVAFQKMACVREIVIVAAPEFHEQIRAHAQQFGIDKVSAIVEAGVRRQDSVLNGAMAATSPIVAVHDSARPFPPTDLEHAVAKLYKLGANACATYFTQMTDTIRTRSTGDILQRDDLLAMQTPQLSYRTALIAALELANAQSTNITDDISAMQLLNAQVLYVQGSRDNIKITYPSDHVVARALAQLRTANSNE